MSKLVAISQVAAADRAKSLFARAKEEGKAVADSTLATATEAMQQLQEASEVPTLPPGVQDVFHRMAEKLRGDILIARAILERT